MKKTIIVKPRHRRFRVKSFKRTIELAPKGSKTTTDRKVHRVKVKRDRYGRLRGTEW